MGFINYRQYISIILLVSAYCFLPLPLWTPFEATQSYDLTTHRLFTTQTVANSQASKIPSSVCLWNPLLGALCYLKPRPAVRFCRLWQRCPTTAWLSPGQCSVFRALTVEDRAAVGLESRLKTEGVPCTSERINTSLLQRELYECGIKMYENTKTHSVTENPPPTWSHFTGNTVLKLCTISVTRFN